jgi:hypothetical protein
MATAAAMASVFDCKNNVPMSLSPACSASSSGFVASGDAAPSPEAAGQAGGPGMAAMGDMMDAFEGAFSGDGKRVERAVEDLTQGGAGERAWHTLNEIRGARCLEVRCAWQGGLERRH